MHLLELAKLRDRAAMEGSGAVCLTGNELGDLVNMAIKSIAQDQLIKQFNMASRQINGTSSKIIDIEADVKPQEAKVESTPG